MTELVAGGYMTREFKLKAVITSYTDYTNYPAKVTTRPTYLSSISFHLPASSLQSPKTGSLPQLAILLARIHSCGLLSFGVLTGVRGPRR